MTMVADASTIKKLKSMVASKDAQVEALNGRIEVLMDDLVEARAERDHIRTTCFRLEDVVRQCQQEAEELEERATAAEERAASAEAALVGAERDIAARRRSGSPTLDADALRRHNAQLEAELDALRDRLIVQTEAELSALPAPRIAAAAHLVAPPAAAPAAAPPRRAITLKAMRPSRAAADAPPVAELPARLQGSPEERERWSQEVSRATGAVAPAAYVVPPLISAAKPEPAPAPAPAAASRPRSSSPRAQPGRSVYASTHASRTAAAAAAAATREEEVRRQLAVMTAARERALAAVAAL